MAIGAGLAVAGIASAVIGGNAAKKAAKSESQAGALSLDLQRDVFETTERNALPNIEGGQLGLAALLSELGLGEAPLIGQETKFTGTRDKSGESETFDTRREAETFAKRKGSVEEFTTGGTPFAGFQESPGFKFAFQQGVNAVDASAAAGGGLFSGSTLEDLTKFGQGFASQGRGVFLNRLQNLVNSGQVGVGQVSGAGQAFAQGGSQTIEGMGNAQAAGTIGRADATIGGINSLATTAGSVFGGFSGGGGFGF